MVDQLENSENKVNDKRFHWVDNLRSFMVFLVVVGHGSVVYERYAMGTDWWIVVDPAGNDFPGILYLILNIFVIATLFFVSGFLAIRSLEQKIARDYIYAKFKRLIIPWFIAVLTLIPIYKMIFLYSRGMPQENWINYFHWNSIWSQNWLWFLPVLFLFDIVFLGLSKLPVQWTWVTMRRGIWIAILLCVMVSFSMDFLGLHGWTKTILVDFQNERLFLYFVAYLMGALSFKQNVFWGDWKHKKMDLILHCTGWIPINLYLFMLIYSLIKPDSPLISQMFDTLLLRINFVLAFAYLIYAMTVSFKRYVDRKGSILNEINANSYGVYIIHVVVIGFMALALRDTGLPSLMKLFLTVVVTYLVSNLSVSFYKRFIVRTFS